MTPWLHVHEGVAPLIISIPHAGTVIPQEIISTLRSLSLAVRDADWFIPQLYDFALDLGATVIRTDLSRTAIDVNRDPSGGSLYPGQVTTGLCPDMTFDGEPLYLEGRAPDAGEVDRRRTAYFTPYHQALDNQIARLKRDHGRVALFDAHSIRSRVAPLFEGQLPALNLGTHSGASADPRLVAVVEAQCETSGFSHVTNGRFKGGWITRHYGRPADGIHALQMEMAQRVYMDEPLGLALPVWAPERAAAARGLLRPLLQSMIDWTLDKAAT
jgi:N-formylglutamate deformylase